MDLASLSKNILEKDEILKLLYIDTIQPGVIQVGLASESILELGNTILIPIKCLNGMAQLNFKKAMNDYQKKFESIVEEDINLIPPEIGVDILERLKIVQNVNIRELYVNILAAASKKDSYPNVHPKIMKTVELLTPDEAVIIEALSTTKLYGIKVVLKEIKKPQRKTDYLGLEIAEESRKQELNPIFTNIDNKLIFVCNTTIYFENLLEWGLIKLRSCEVMAEHEIIREAYFGQIEELEKKYIVSESFKLELQPYCIDLTEFGDKFIDVCIRS